MEIRLYIFGDVNKRGYESVSADKSIREILNKHAQGMAKNKKLKLVQIGGPLGVCLTGAQIDDTLAQYIDEMDANTILFLNDSMCPVDFIRFLTRYVTRELRVSNDRIQELGAIVENISKGQAKPSDGEWLEKQASEIVRGYPESALFGLVKYIVKEFRIEIMEHIIYKRCRTGICRRLFNALCSNACPAGVNVPGFMALMAEGIPRKAYSVMRQTTPFSFVCTRLCEGACESACRRGEFEETVDVRALQAYAADMVLEMGEYKENKQKPNGKRIAVVGAGLAGLAAAYFLAKTGYDVVIYEANKFVGGKLPIVVPEDRLPQVLIDKEVQLLRNLGIEIRINTRVGVDISLSEVRKTSDAILLATGCHLGDRLEEITGQGIETGIDFLEEVKSQCRTTVGKNVLVIGGGDVGMAAAKTAKRLGAQTVKVVWSEEFEALPEGEKERNEAIEDGVEVVAGYGFKEIKLENDKAKEVTIRRCLSVLDNKGRFSPEYDDTDFKTYETDHLILATGQRPDTSYLDENIALTERSFLKINPTTFETSVKGVFAVGDMCRQKSAIETIAEAKNAAEAIDNRLGGGGLYLGEKIDIPEPQLHYGIWDIQRPKGRLMSSFTMDEARKEAARCLRCDRNSRQ